jgi:DNA excision repair protein ERCC-6
MERAHESRNPKAIVILPPESGDMAVPSDEELVDDADDGFETAGEVELEEDDVDDTAEEGDDGSGVTRWSKKHSLRKFGALTPAPLPFIQNTSDEPFDLWSKIFNDPILNLIHKQTTLYARRDKNNVDFQLTKDELNSFLGICLLSGYHSLPSETDYWSRQPDLQVPIVAETMTRNRFQEIKAMIHLADNAKLQQGNKVAKVQPLYDILNRNLVQFGIFHQDLSIDESIVPYFGKHSCKMYIKGKPIRFGYKLWCLCGSDGFPYHLEIYTGRKAASDGPLGTRVINTMIDVVKCHSCVKDHEFFFDNFFTSYDLLSDLSQQDIRATGTVRENRTAGANRLFTPRKEFQKEVRGHSESRCDGMVHITKWHDNSTVHIMSTVHGLEPIHEARRWGKDGQLQVKQPHLIWRYNAGMGGVDVMDKLLAAYRPNVRSKKWWWPLFTHALNVSVIAAWRVHCALNEKKNTKSHLQFRRDIALTLLKMSTREAHHNGRLVALPERVILDGLDHISVEATQGRCVVCHQNTRKKCQKCDVRLHHDKGGVCHDVYHKRISH